MQKFRRYAIYHLPTGDLGAFGARWLGWDAVLGQCVVQPDIEGISEWTATPARYGFHATLKPPFRLAPGATEAELKSTCKDLAEAQEPIALDALSLVRMGRFLALRPTGDSTRVNALAATCVQQVDRFRAPLTEDELARRRAARLSPEHEENLVRWGYPYVMAAFRYHLTLTGRLPKPELNRAETVLRDALRDVNQPQYVSAIALVGESADGRFRLIESYPLRASRPAPLGSQR